MTHLRSGIAFVMLCLFAQSLPSQQRSKIQGKITCTAIAESKDHFLTDPNHGYVSLALVLPKNAEKLSISAHVRLPDYVNSPGGGVVFVTSAQSRFGNRWVDCDLRSFCGWPPIPGAGGMEAFFQSFPHPDPDGTQRYEVKFSKNSLNPIGEDFPVVRLALTYTMPGPLCTVEAISEGLSRKAPTTTELLIPVGAKIVDWSDLVAPEGSDQWKRCEDKKTASRCGHDYRLQSNQFVEPDKSDGAHGRLWSCGNDTDQKMFCRMDLKYDPNPAGSSGEDQGNQGIPSAEP